MRLRILYKDQGAKFIKDGFNELQEKLGLLEPTTLRVEMGFQFSTTDWGQLSLGSITQARAALLGGGTGGLCNGTGEDLNQSDLLGSSVQVAGGQNLN